MTTNASKFCEELARQYADLFVSDPDYAYSAARCSPAGLAATMTEALAKGSGNKEGKGIQRTCKTLGVKYTYTAIRAYLKGEA